MIILDANVLLYAYDATALHHAEARTWLENVFSGGTPVGMPWQTVGAFLRIVTNPRLPGQRFTMEDAIAVIDTWFQQPNVRFLAPGENHWQILREELLEGQVRGPLVTDAQLAALTIEYGGVLQTTDRDFARFTGLRWNNPLDRRPRS
jgi:toxin-antitoxin system PIN domain toxin